MANDNNHNIVLIGMPGVGKSTVGVLLAKRLSRAFVDTDVLIQVAEGLRLQAIIDTLGLAAFCEIESRHICSLRCRASVIATGGSAVYSSAAMAHLKQGSVVVHLDLPLAALVRRLTDLDSRGVVRPAGVTLEALYAERQPLYQRYADLTIDCRGLAHNGVVDAIQAAVQAT
jgi:shikimate kinase